MESSCVPAWTSLDGRCTHTSERPYVVETDGKAEKR
jgi:hypothetical protein